MDKSYRGFGRRVVCVAMVALTVMTGCAVAPASGGQAGQEQSTTEYFSTNNYQALQEWLNAHPGATMAELRSARPDLAPLLAAGVQSLAVAYSEHLRAGLSTAGLQDLLLRRQNGETLSPEDAARLNAFLDAFGRAAERTSAAHDGCGLGVGQFMDVEACAAAQWEPGSDDGGGTGPAVEQGWFVVLLVIAVVAVITYVVTSNDIEDNAAATQVRAVAVSAEIAPYADINDALADLDDQLEAGTITEEEYDRRLTELVRRFEELENGQGGGGAPVP